MNYLAALAEEIRREVPQHALPEEDTSALFTVYAVLLLAKGKEVGREDVHNAWTAWMLARGESHESMIPLKDLPPGIKEEDDAFVKAIRRVAGRHGR